MSQIEADRGYVIDSFNNGTKSVPITLSNNNKTATNTNSTRNGYNFQTVRGTHEMSQGEHRFRIRIDKIGPDYYGEIHIGVVPSNSSRNAFQDGWTVDFWVPQREYLNKIERGYGKKCKDGDEITMIVDCDNYTVSYEVNDEKIGTVYTKSDGVKGTLILGVDLAGYTNTKVTIL
ncbi:spry domain-containing socs box protein [Anaeramoeba flamelloides]|uniref:Spry domain-containing socs box protein n=1 Tax=Anaeramoeba flamelloides TaxID=1746091 RepID=A0AAV8A225_9EUKA|nr:spry domain-containing socs box protein [Anaeramoeba flamelloides]KAJ6243765.1 spry domain-containing socs box protein [Anaeramoeba flamelloides]